MSSFITLGRNMSYEELYEESWDLFKLELMVGSLGSMLMGEIIAEYIDRGYYLLRLHGNTNHVEARFDRGEFERIRLEMKMHPTSLGSLFSFGGICHITAYRGIQGDLSGFMTGQVKEVLSNVGDPEPGVYMVNQDGTSYFIGTTIYFNIKDHLDLNTFRLDPKGILQKVDEVLNEIARKDSGLEVK
jgi:hypothetical protein